MKRIVRILWTTAFCLFLLLACQRLVERPSSLEPAQEPLLPLAGAMLQMAAADMPSERPGMQTVQHAPLRRSLPVQEPIARAWMSAPVCDGNGMPLAQRSYVRTVYTACRLSETSG